MTLALAADQDVATAQLTQMESGFAKVHHADKPDMARFVVNPASLPRRLAGPAAEILAEEEPNDDHHHHRL
ncbi:MAG: hypothetical protein ACR2FH_05960 [Caulobacteraceae bacterium]